MSAAAPGPRLRRIADLVGPEGNACGVDISEIMLAEAAARANGLGNIEFTKGEAYALPHENAAFDAVRMERVLPYVPDRIRAIREMMRVTRREAGSSSPTSTSKVPPSTARIAP